MTRYAPVAQREDGGELLGGTEAGPFEEEAERRTDHGGQHEIGQRRATMERDQGEHVVHLHTLLKKNAVPKPPINTTARNNHDPAEKRAASDR